MMTSAGARLTSRPCTPRPYKRNIDREHHLYGSRARQATSTSAVDVLIRRDVSVRPSKPEVHRPAGIRLRYIMCDAMQMIPDVDHHHHKITSMDSIWDGVLLYFLGCMAIATHLLWKSQWSISRAAHTARWNTDSQPHGYGGQLHAHFGIWFSVHTMASGMSHNPSSTCFCVCLEGICKSYTPVSRPSVARTADMTCRW